MGERGQLSHFPNIDHVQWLISEVKEKDTHPMAKSSWVPQFES